MGQRNTKISTIHKLDKITEFSRSVHPSSCNFESSGNVECAWQYRPLYLPHCSCSLRSTPQGHLWWCCAIAPRSLGTAVSIPSAGGHTWGSSPRYSSLCCWPMDSSSLVWWLACSCDWRCGRPLCWISSLDVLQTLAHPSMPVHYPTHIRAWAWPASTKVLSHLWVSGHAASCKTVPSTLSRVGRGTCFVPAHCTRTRCVQRAL